MKKSPLSALLNSKWLEISPKNGWRARVAGEPWLHFLTGGGGGFEPTIPFGIPAFQASALDHYATPP